MASNRNRWIISDHRFHEHTTAESAQQEIARLRAKFPEKQFRIYRVKYPARAGVPVNAATLEAVSPTTEDAA